MNTKPWKVEGPLPQGGFMTGWHRVFEADGSTVAYAPDHVTARLIAVAPGMLEALETATALLEDARLVMDMDREKNLMEWLPGIRATIAKARPKEDKS